MHAGTLVRDIKRNGNVRLYQRQAVKCMRMAVNALVAATVI